MTEPTITFKHTNIGVDYELQELFTRKLLSLRKYFVSDEVLCEVEFRKETLKTSNDSCVVEANLSDDGQLFRVKASGINFEKAVDEARDELDKKVRRSKRKRNNLFLKGARQIKNLMTFNH